MLPGSRAYNASVRGKAPSFLARCAVALGSPVMATFLVDGSGVVRQQRLGALVAGAGDQEWTPAWLKQVVRALSAV